MELKRYVMIRKEIFEVEDQAQFRDNTQVAFRAKSEDYNRTIYLGDDYKTSDNILDLVEVGDLVGINKFILYVSDMDDGYFYLLNYFNMDGDELVKNSNLITSIYKLQPNGDYKRYEVK